MKAKEDEKKDEMKSFAEANKQETMIYGYEEYSVCRIRRKKTLLSLQSFTSITWKLQRK